MYGGSHMTGGSSSSSSGNQESSSIKREMQDDDGPNEGRRKRQNFGSTSDTYTGLAANGDVKMKTSESQVADSPYGAPPYTGNDGSHTDFVMMTRGCPYPRSGNVHIRPTTKLFPKLHTHSEIKLLLAAGDIPDKGAWMGNLSLISRGRGVNQRLGDKISATGLSLNLAITCAWNEYDGSGTSKVNNAANYNKNTQSLRLVIFARKDTMGSANTDVSTIYNTSAAPTRRADNFMVQRNLDFTSDIQVLHTEIIDFNTPYVSNLHYESGFLVGRYEQACPSVTRVVSWECGFRALEMLYASSVSDAVPAAQLGTSIQWAIYTTHDTNDDINTGPLAMIFEMESRLYFIDD